MNRILTMGLGVLLGAVALDGLAQDRGYDRGRDGARSFRDAGGYTDQRNRGLPLTARGPERRQDNTSKFHGGYRDDRYGGRGSGYRGRGDRDHHGNYRYYDGRHDYRDRHWRSAWNHGWSGSRYRAPSRYAYPRGYSSFSWSIGYRMPSAFLGGHYYVDYRPYGLAPPPYGARWIRADRDVLLVVLATGVVLDILHGFYY